MAFNHPTPRPVGKKYVVACDGTWQNSDMGNEKSGFQPPTLQVSSNVPRIVRALNHNHSNGTPQIVFYQRGVGTDNDLQDRLIGGLTGDDISEHIREAYAFLVNNFSLETQADLDDVTKPLDEIILLGFSRGAYTARAIASLISDVGLLTKIGMESFWGVFGDWMKQDVKGEENKWFKATYGKDYSFTDPRYRQTLIDNGLTRWGMPIKAIGVWDTVGALGIPIDFSKKNVKPYSFVNQKVARGVQYAFHALALDEHRHLFVPTIWEQPKPPHNLTHLKQCWFPGSHSNIGGSYDDAGQSNISLAWMISQLEDADRETGGILSFDPSYLDWVQDLNTKYYVQTAREPVRPWGFGKLYDSSLVDGVLKGAEAIAPIYRTPGRYNRISNEDGRQMDNEPLEDTGEFIHRCVRVRIDGHGKGPEEAVGDNVVEKAINVLRNKVIKAEAPKYDSPALANFRLVEAPALKMEVNHSSAGYSGVVWKGLDGKGDLKEDALGRTEIRLLKRSMLAAHQ